MKGIDISEHNGNINFYDVKNSGIEYVILRLGWIGNKNNHTLDKKFEEYYTQCKNAGLKVGIYVYSYCKSISAIQSGGNWTLEKLKNKQIDLPVFIDLEDNTILECGRNELTNHALYFCKTIEANGLNAGTYANLNWFNNYLNVNFLEKYYIWLAQYTNASNHSAKFKVDIWQYSSKGSINGIKGNVDMNNWLNCQNLPEITENQNSNQKGDYEVKIYQNGTTKEPVYSDINANHSIGYLHAHEIAECYGVVNNKAIIVYNVDGTNNKKVGFVKWLRWNKIAFHMEYCRIKSRLFIMNTFR